MTPTRAILSNRYSVIRSPYGSSARNSRGRFPKRLDSELPDRVAAHHARNQRLRYIGGAQAGQCIPGARCIVMRIARAPNHLAGEVLRQLLDHPLLGIEAEHDVAVLPHLFRFGADRIVM